MYVFLNELSFSGQALSPEDSWRLMLEVQKVLNKLKPLIGIDTIGTSQKLWEYSISPGYTVRDYVYDKKIDQVKRLLFQKLVTNGPYVEKLLDQSVSYHECFFEKQDVTGSSLAAACCFDGVLASLMGFKRFSHGTLSALYRENDDEFSQFEIPNQFDSQYTEDFVKNFFKGDIKNWKDFWEKRKKLFSHITFCDEVEKQLQHLSFSPMIFRNIIRHLEKINEYAGKYLTPKVQNIDCTQIGIESSKESDITTLIKHINSVTY